MGNRERRIEVAPSLLASDFGRLADEIKRAEDAGADRLHVDVMDGHFVPNITVGPFIVEAIKRNATVPLDVHLMITDPLKYLGPFADAGADTLTFHREAVEDPRAAARAFRDKGVHPGISVNPESPVDGILDVLDAVDQVLIMTVHPGFGGQEFITENVEKVRQVRAAGRPELHIAVDGGINEQTAALVCAAGADVLIAGTYLFKSADMKAALASLRRACVDPR
ncbi:MAG TPA: ribulose-phosphate 3-epimerase [Planctomycetota bacterium]|nr:ribulose-phosphate 3-epimerase [Planctomycetota bacterium]